MIIHLQDHIALHFSRCTHSFATDHFLTQGIFGARLTPADTEGLQLLSQCHAVHTGMPGMCVHLFRTPECNYDLRGEERRNGNRGQMKGTDLLLPSLKTTEKMKHPRLFSLCALKDSDFFLHSPNK